MTKVTDTHSAYAIHIAFQLQQWLRTFPLLYFYCVFVWGTRLGYTLEPQAPSYATFEGKYGVQKMAEVLSYEICKWLKVITKLGVFKHILTVAGGVLN
jgi:hypothetical protein